MILKPLEKPLTYWFSGGDIIWRGDGRCVAITDVQAEALRDLYADEVKAARLAGDEAGSKQAVTLWLQLTEALTALDEWRRVIRADAREAVRRMLARSLEHELRRGGEDV